MNLTKGFIVFSAFLTTSCLASIIVKSIDFNKSRLIEAVVQILESCYGDREATVGLAGSSTGVISKMMWSRGSPPITLVDDTSRTLKSSPVGPPTRYRLQLFVVTAPSSTALAGTLKEIKASGWWNHMATFLIVALPLSNHGCRNAFEMLWVVWEMNILDAKLLCFDQAQGRLIYTFNPYTSRAPGPWQLDKIYSGKNDHPWTLFVRRYDEAEDICNQLDFEKTDDLGGYEVRVSVTADAYGHESTKSDRICVGIYEDTYCKLFYPALKATPRVLVHSSFNKAGYMDKDGNPHGILAEVAYGLSDFSVTSRYITSLPNVTTLYPHWLCQLNLMTQYRGYKSQLRKICSVVDSSSRVGLCLVCLINILIFKYMFRQSTMVSCMSTMRMICNAPLPMLPKKMALRTYLGSVFLFALTIQGIYQGRLASLLTSEDPLRNVDTKEDLVDLGHTVYGSKTYRMYFDDLELQGRFIGLTENVCTDIVLRDPKAACANDKSFLVSDAVKYKLHLSSDSVVNVFSAFPIRKDWPLERRANTILLKSMEAYLPQYAYFKWTGGMYRTIEFQENEYKDKGFKILTLEQLSFAFAILGIGLVCATVGFVIELTIVLL